MITAVCLNPCIDRFVRVQTFALGETNRIASEYSISAGKGVHVAIATARLGLESRLVGLLGEENGDPIAARLAADGVPHEFVRYAGAVRVNLKIQEQTGLITELNEAGHPVAPADVEAVVSRILSLAAPGSYLVLTGSLPPGCPTDSYARILRAVPPGCRCVLDASGPALIAGLAASPYLVKPNIEELSQAVGKRLSALPEIRQAALSLTDRGIPLVAVSMGAQGALMTDGKRTLYAPSLPVAVTTTVAAGDSMVAGILYGLSMRAELEDLLRCGVAAAAATVSDPEGGLLRRPRFEALLPQVRCEEI